MQWKEPAAFTDVHRSLKGKSSFHRDILYLIMFMVASALMWYIQVFIVKQPVLPLWGLCLTWIAVIACIYLMHFLERRMATTVYIWSNGIGRYTGSGQWAPVFKQLKTFAIRDEDEYRILELVTIKDFTMLIGVPLEVDIAQLEGILMERGVMKRMA